MRNIKYVLNRLSKVDYKTMIKKVSKIHKQTGKSRLSIILDIKKCALKYGAGYMDYDLFEMYNLTDDERDTYITRGRNNELIAKYNKKEYAHFFRNKDEFNSKFQQYLKRDWIKVNDNPKEKIFEFIEKHNIFIAKPINECCGKGIEKIDKNNFNSINQLYSYLIDNKNLELEELIMQQEDVSKIYPESINTVRVITILKDNIPHIICAYFRIGNGKYVDNFNSGGMVAPIDEKTGIVRDIGIDKNKKTYERHPITGQQIKGFQLPEWDKVVEMCKEASRVIPEIAYVGWDVGFSKNGPVFIEANEFPGHDIYQLPEHTTNKIGMMPRFINI